MGNDNKYSDDDLMQSDPKLADFEKFAAAYTDATNIDLVAFNPEVVNILNMGIDQLARLTGDDMANHSFLLDAYAFHLQHLVDRDRVRLNYCEEIINYVVAKNYPDMYADNEIKRSRVIAESVFAQTVENVRLKMRARVDLIRFKITSVKNMAKTLQEAARRRGY